MTVLENKNVPPLQKEFVTGPSHLVKILGLIFNHRHHTTKVTIAYTKIHRLRHTQIVFNVAVVFLFIGIASTSVVISLVSD